MIARTERPVRAADLVVERIGEEAFASLRESWNGLLERSRSNTVFLTWEWLHAWWESFRPGKTLFLLAIRDLEGTLVGLAPLFLAREVALGTVPIRVLRFMGVERVSSEYLDVIAAPGREAVVVEAIVAYLQANGGAWDVAVFSDMDETAGNLALLEAASAGRGWSVRRKAAEVCPYATLPRTYDAFLKGLSASMRYHVGRRTRGLEKQGRVAFERWDDAERLPSALDRLFALHQARWMTRNHAGNFTNDRVRRFHRSVAPQFAERGWLRYRALALDGVPVAVLYGFQYGGRYYYYQSGFDPARARSSPGTVIMGRCIEEAIAEGLREFDYLRGTEAYKWSWTATARRTVTLSVYREALRGRLARVDDRSRSMLKSWLGRLRAEWRKRRRRPEES